MTRDPRGPYRVVEADRTDGYSGHTEARRPGDAQTPRAATQEVSTPMPDKPTKRCPSCCATKPLSEFYLRAKPAQTRNTYCKSCNKKYVREHYLRNREKVLRRGRAHRLLQHYGLTPEAYDNLWNDQDGRSAMSGVELVREAGQKDSAHIDHYDDLNGLPVVRGLLTARENQAIGLLGHDPELCIKAAQYLYRHDLDLRELCLT